MDVNVLIEELEKRVEFDIDHALVHELFAEKTDSPHLGDAEAEEVLCPQQPQPDPPMPLVAGPPSLQQPVLPAPGLDAAPGPFRCPPQINLQPFLSYNGAAQCSEQQFDNVPVVNFPLGQGNMEPVGSMDGMVKYNFESNTAPVVPNDPPVNRPPQEKRKVYRPPGPKDVLYVNKPPSAFMIFTKEQRPIVVAELIVQKWKSLSNNKKAKYYEEADRLHLDFFPEGNAGDNSGKARKRLRRR